MNPELVSLLVSLGPLVAALVGLAALMGWLWWRSERGANEIGQD